MQKVVQEKDGEKERLTTVIITSHGKPNIDRIGSGCKCKAIRTTLWDEQHKDSTGNTAPAAWWKARCLQEKGKLQSCKWKTLGIAKGWGTNGFVQHTTFFMSKFRLKTSHTLHAHKTDLPFRDCQFLWYTRHDLFKKLIRQGLFFLLQIKKAWKQKLDSVNVIVETITQAQPKPDTGFKSEQSPKSNSHPFQRKNSLYLVQKWP